MEQPVDEYLIAETMYLRLGLDWPNESTKTAAAAEANRIEEALKRISGARDGAQVIIGRRALKIIGAHPADPERGTRILAPRKGARIYVQLAVAPVDSPSQWMCARYALLDNWKKGDGEPASLLEVEFNPTTLATGNNIRPATIPNTETGEFPSFPSSAPRVMQALNRCGFRFLEELHGQIVGNQRPLFAARTQKAIEDGDFQIVRGQWCVYFPTLNVPRFLQLMAILFGHTIAQENGIVQLARHLGMNLTIHTDPHSNRVTGITLQKSHGKKPLYSLVFYDKRVRVAQMRQGKTLTNTERTTVDKNVRFDMTAHKLGVLEIIRAGQRALRPLRTAEPTLFDAFAQRFLDEKAEPCAWWLERAVFVLSHVRDDKTLRRGSFATWLVPKMVREVLHLDVVANFTGPSLQRLLELKDPIASAWREIKPSDPDHLLRDIAKKAKCSKSTLYERRKLWRAKYKVDIALPLAFYRDLQAIGPVSLATPETRTALNAAVARKDAESTLRVLSEAAKDFDAQRTAVVGTVISGGPLMMSSQPALAPTRHTTKSAAQIPANVTTSPIRDPRRPTARPPLPAPAPHVLQPGPAKRLSPTMPPRSHGGSPVSTEGHGPVRKLSVAPSDPPAGTLFPRPRQTDGASNTTPRPRNIGKAPPRSGR